ncbi:preprotein translocase subunit YajC [Mucilaginibacter aquariorum]|uniref:Sec translocon accessory complex subunit YajC n=1 Tax=Mucilaginibacter aquariorum TaxID=2967225 RepID=A0ABT1T0B3_9SPHI|nr:preprotein translocase subunit YajC [Mucilaginibacter aquariorum]MCQ6958038.1 preprotein translocase subunit YajC [Mucilaginibacter aquariorum]
MIATVLLQAGGGLGVPQLIMFAAIAVVFYFFMIRPQMQKQKEQKKYVEELKKGDKIITTAGIHGRIFEVAETTFLIEVEGGTKIRFDKSAVSLDASKALNTPAATK